MDINHAGQEEHKYETYNHEEIFGECFPLMKEIRRQGKLCDVTLKVEDQTFSAHRIVLAGTIPYFYAMFTNNMAESHIKEITMKEIEPSALETLINYAYSGQVRIHHQNVQSLMVGASFLQLTRVRNACADFLISRFNPHNVLCIRSLADSIGCTHLIEAADKYVDLHFSNVSKSDEFLTLEFDVLSELIRRDELDEQEGTIFEACLKWVKHDEEIRAPMFPEILAKVRLPLLSPQFLADRVAREELIRSSHQCRDLLDEAVYFHLMPQRRDLIPSFRTRYRNNGLIEGQIFAVGGLTSTRESVSTVEIYDPFIKDWKPVEPMSVKRCRVGVAVMDGKLYAFGGFNGQNDLPIVEEYNPKTNKWSLRKPMLYKTSVAGVAALDDFIYVCGEYDEVNFSKTFECYCPKLDTWKTVSPMLNHRSAGGVAALNGFVFALGGHDGVSVFDSVERYDPVQNVWTKMNSMLNGRCRLGVATLNGKLYACGGYDGNSILRSVEVYNPDTDSWKYVSPMKCKRSRVVLTANMGKLWAIGGFDAETQHSTVEVYDPEIDEWSYVPLMCTPPGRTAAAIINWTEM